MSKISVCIATYNGALYIKQQLDSIRNQLSAFDEIIVSDDSSNDDTISVIESLNDPRITIIRNQKFKNPTYNFENALKRATGDFIFLSDQDDVWDSQKVEICLPYFEKNDLILSDCTLVDDKLKIIATSFFELNRSKPGILRNLMIKNAYMGCCMAFKREVRDKALTFPKNLPMHDLWIGLIAEIYFTPIFVPQKLVLYRRHLENASSTSLKSKNTFLQKMKIRMKVSFFLIEKLFGLSLSTN